MPFDLDSTYTTSSKLTRQTYFAFPHEFMVSVHSF